MVELGYIELLLGGITNVHSFDQRDGLLGGWVDARGYFFALLALLVLFNVHDFLQEDVETSFGKAAFLIDDLVVLINQYVTVLFLHGDEVLLGMRPDLSSGPGADEVLDASPVLAKKADSLQKFVVFVIGPPALQNSLIRHGLGIRHIIRTANERVLDHGPRLFEVGVPRTPMVLSAVEFVILETGNQLVQIVGLVQFAVRSPPCIIYVLVSVLLARDGV